MRKLITLVAACLTFLAIPMAAQTIGQQFNPSGAMESVSATFPRTTSSLRVRTTSQVSIVPAEGRVSSLKEFVITFADAESVTRGNVGYGNAPTVHKTGDPEGSKQYCFNMSFEGNVMTLNVNTEIVEEGDWTLTLPAGFYLIDGVETNETLEFDYTIASVSPVEGEIIYEAPLGTKVDCMTRVLGWAVINNQLVGQEFAGKPMHYVIGNDGALYIYNAIILNPFTGEQMNTYIKGVKDGDDYLFTFPQPIYEETIEGETKTWYVNKLKIERYDDGGSAYIVADENSIRMKINEDGSLETSQPMAGAAEECVGTMVDGLWNGFGSTRMLYRSFNFVAAEPPADLEVNDAEMKYRDLEGAQKSAYLKYGIVDTNIWIKGMGLDILPEAWVHGTIEDDQITFDPYVGCSEEFGQYVFLRGCNYSESLELLSTEFTFDRQNMTLSCNTNLCLNSNNEFWYAFEALQYCVIELETGNPDLTSRVPKGPVAVSRFETVDADAGTYDMTVELSNLNIDGQQLEEKRLAYQVILPDNSVYVFQPYRYSGISTSLTEIPYNTDLKFIEASGNNRSFTLKGVKDIADIGVRIIYKDATGSYLSEIAWYKTTGVRDIEISEDVTQTIWYDLTGRQVASPASGIYICIEYGVGGERIVRKVSVK